MLPPPMGAHGLPLLGQTSEHSGEYSVGRSVCLSVDELVRTVVCVSEGWWFHSQYTSRGVLEQHAEPQYASWALQWQRAASEGWVKSGEPVLLHCTVYFVQLISFSFYSSSDIFLESLRSSKHTLNKVPILKLLSHWAVSRVLPVLLILGHLPPVTVHNQFCQS